MRDKAFVWDDTDKGVTIREIPIPEDLEEVAQEYRMKIIEGVAEERDDLFEKFMEDPHSITEEEMIDVIRTSTIKYGNHTCICVVLLLRIKVFR